ncbi:MAG: hypothetical protein SVU32_06330 [Candidatus Nanohaloarchaea archaeon]|nr:hypothetical protein [Candidatus Nanohaloarchaea archaeon]
MTEDDTYTSVVTHLKSVAQDHGIYEENRDLFDQASEYASKKMDSDTASRLASTMNQLEKEIVSEFNKEYAGVLADSAHAEAMDDFGSQEESTEAASQTAEEIERAEKARGDYQILQAADEAFEEQAGEEYTQNRRHVEEYTDIDTNDLQLREDRPEA